MKNPIYEVFIDPFLRLRFETSGIVFRRPDLMGFIPGFSGLVLPGKFKKQKIKRKKKEQKSSKNLKNRGF